MAASSTPKLIIAFSPPPLHSTVPGRLAFHSGSLPILKNTITLTSSSLSSPLLPVVKVASDILPPNTEQPEEPSKSELEQPPEKPKVSHPKPRGFGSQNGGKRRGKGRKRRANISLKNGKRMGNGGGEKTQQLQVEEPEEKKMNTERPGKVKILIGKWLSPAGWERRKGERRGKVKSSRKPEYDVHSSPKRYGEWLILLRQNKTSKKSLMRLLR